MDYFQDLHIARPVKVKPFDGKTDTTKIENDTIVIKFDPEYFSGLLDSVHTKINKIKSINLNPKYAIMNYKTYEQMLNYHFNMVREINPKFMFSLIPIVSTEKDNYVIDVVCDPFDEIRYLEELSKVRFEEK